MIRFAVVATMMALAAPAAGAPKLDPQFGDHAVIQRGQPIAVTGNAGPGETLTVTLGDRRATTRAGKDGRFVAGFAAMASGGPLTLTVTGASGAETANDILIGDVFLCSGQSNMELQVSRAQDSWSQTQSSADPSLRLMTIDKTTALRPQASFAKTPAWVVAGPATVGDFSAACYYMVKTLRQRTANVPIGAIASSWGGTAISAWMGDRALMEGGRATDARLLQLYIRDPAAAARQAGAIWEAWWRQQTGDAPGREPWRPDAALDWRPVPKIDVWEHWSVPALADYNGMVWFRREVTLTAAQARGAATLAIGSVDDMDRTWMNGVAVGANGNPGALRRYPLPAGTLHAGRNVIVVNANDVYADGGMRGPAEAMKLELSDGSAIPLGDGWTYAIAKPTPANTPRVPWDDIAGAGVIYNAMIAPLGSFKLAGVAWYQGETDVGSTGYADRLVAMMADWRRQFGQPTLPFAIAQLSSFGTPATAPAQSGTAALREEQRLAAIRDPHAALAVTIDLGDPLDVHPGEKHEVGRRLARAMAALAYGDPRSPSGPAIASGTATPDGGVTLQFAGVTAGLHTRGSDRAIGFELCGAGGHDCRYALGTVAGDEVKLAGDGKPATEVRYAWADATAVNLFDATPLPVGPFRIVVAR